MTVLATVVVGALSITMSAGSSAGKPNFLTVLADGECKESSRVFEHCMDGVQLTRKLAVSTPPLHEA